LHQSTVSLIQSLKTERVDDLILAENKITISTCLEAQTVREIKKNVSEKDLLKIVSFMITTCISSFNVTTKPSHEQQRLQIYTMANDFIDKFRNESLEDFALCFKKARTAEMGTSYNRIDSETLFGFMRVHLESKAYERENVNAKLKYPKIDNTPSLGPPKDPEALKHYEAIGKIAKDLKTGNYKKDLFPNRDKPTHESFIDNLSKRVKIMSETELAETLKSAINGKLKDVEQILKQELERRLEL
jgi:hypothetical protein